MYVVMRVPAPPVSLAILCKPARVFNAHTDAPAAQPSLHGSVLQVIQVMGIPFMKFQLLLMEELPETSILDVPPTARPALQTPKLTSSVTVA